MSLINHNAKEIHCKIVYCGPSLGGKTTNVQWIYNQSQGEDKSELTVLPSDVERTLFFDFLPLSVGKIRGMSTRFHLYTVPGQVVYENSRRQVLKGLDGVIFVADSQLERMEENIQSLEDLEENLQRQGYEPGKVPMAIQYNKRDLPNVMPVEEMRYTLNRYNVPDFEACARKGQGVFPALKVVSKAIITLLKGGDLE